MPIILYRYYIHACMYYFVCPAPSLHKFGTWCLVLSLDTLFVPTLIPSSCLATACNCLFYLVAS
ncbi:hypothetical protein F5Y00DRAFT_235539 [Daldinia vernicosa]|uniref:uncharacterized protein n=1 Tax=Daldinia vernicosa TaxID=114800 RepID=UPI002007A7BD|nr:uncharacterized protein F5Y00DRAFT_235539 [Daldinia vernicosa]KAI0849358.1 hypothetical protein F5Y00DRAFT_235539 [Daldinia vernicosa]